MCIRDRSYKPSKPTVIAFAIALELPLVEMKDMLMKAGFALSHSNNSLCHRRPANRAFPNPVQPSEKTVHTSVKLPERGIGVCFAGEASPRSPELSTLPEYVDRVNHSTILRFLVHTVAA